MFCESPWLIQTNWPCFHSGSLKYTHRNDTRGVLPMFVKTLVKTLDFIDIIDNVNNRSDQLAVLC